MDIRAKTKYLVLTVLITLFLWFIFTNHHTIENKSQNSEQATFKNSTNHQKKSEVLSSEKLPVPSMGKKKQCEDMAEVIYHARQKWRVHKFPNGDQLLDMGYSVDEVTLAIAHFINKKGATMWRTNHFKNESFSGKKNKRITDYFISIVNGLGATGFRAYYKYPQPEFEKFHKMSVTKKQQVLIENDPVVDDIAAFIRMDKNDERKLSRDELLTLLSHVKYPDQIVSETASPLLTLLDYSILRGYWDMFDYLIQKNVSITEDWYLKTSLDWALRRLSYLLNNESDKKTDISNTVKMISVLMEKGAEAHIDISDPERITNNTKATFPEFNFNQKQIDQLFEKYQLDLRNIKKIPIPDMDLISDAIINRFEKAKSDFIQQEISKQNYELSRKDCRAYIKADYFNRF